jgi:hypothetical protein
MNLNNKDTAMANASIIPIGTTRLGPGWHEGIAMGTYLADPAVSASKLWKLHSTTPAHLRHELTNPVDDTTDPKALGNVLHTAVNEPDELDARYVVLGTCGGKKNDGERCSYQGKVYRDGQSFCGTHDPAKGEPEQPGIHTVAGGMKKQALAMKEALFAHPTAGPLLRAPGPREITVVWQDEETGLWCRIRPDQVVRDPPTLPAPFHESEVNLKSTGRSASHESFTRHAHDLGYYFRAAFYRMGLDATGFWPQNQLYPVVESTPPHEVIVYRMDEEALAIGEAEVRQALLTLAQCKRTGVWPGYGPEVRHLTLPHWRLRHIDRLDFVEAAS